MKEQFSSNVCSFDGGKEFYYCNFCGAWTHSNLGIRFNIDTGESFSVGRAGACPQCAKEYLMPLRDMLEKTLSEERPAVRKKYATKSRKIEEKLRQIWSDEE